MIKYMNMFRIFLGLLYVFGVEKIINPKNLMPSVKTIEGEILYQSEISNQFVQFILLTSGLSLIILLFSNFFLNPPEIMSCKILKFLKSPNNFNKSFTQEDMVILKQK